MQPISYRSFLDVQVQLSAIIQPTYT